MRQANATVTVDGVEANELAEELQRQLDEQAGEDWLEITRSWLARRVRILTAPCTHARATVRLAS